MNETLQRELKDALSPQAVALIHAHITGTDGRTPAGKEVAWFADELMKLVGGPNAINSLYEEIGL